MQGEISHGENIFISVGIHSVFEPASCGHMRNCRLLALWGWFRFICYLLILINMPRSSLSPLSIFHPVTLKACLQQAQHLLPHQKQFLGSSETRLAVILPVFDMIQSKVFVK